MKKTVAATFLLSMLACIACGIIVNVICGFADHAHGVKIAGIFVAVLAVLFTGAWILISGLGFCVSVLGLRLYIAWLLHGRYGTLRLAVVRS